jgi:phage protein D
LPPRRNNYNTEDIPTHPRFLQWARNPFLNMRNCQIDEGIKLQERRTEVVDAPLGQARPVSPFFPIRTFESTYVMQRYYTARRVQMEKEKARNAREAEKQRAKEAKNASASSSRPSQRSVNLQPGEEAQTQPTLGSHSSGLSTLSTPATAAASAVTTRWVRFWLAACCISAQNANDHC